MICNKPKGSCNSCCHYRRDKEKEKTSKDFHFSCFAKVDYKTICGNNNIKEIPNPEVLFALVDWDAEEDIRLSKIIPINIKDLRHNNEGFDEDCVCDYLSDTYGYCINGYSIIDSRAIDSLCEFSNKKDRT